MMAQERLVLNLCFRCFLCQLPRKKKIALSPERRHEGTGTGLREAKIYSWLWHKPCRWPGGTPFLSLSTHASVFPSEDGNDISVVCFVECFGSNLFPLNGGTETKLLRVEFL